VGKKQLPWKKVALLSACKRPPDRRVAAGG
jgi:hypothetical protein